MKNIKTAHSENQTHTRSKSKTLASSNTRNSPPQHNLIPCPPMRAQCVTLLYRAQANLHFSRSTLFLAFSLLDRLLQRGLALNEETYQLVAGSILLLCTKFNEVYPVTVRKLNLLAQGEFSLQQYVDAEAAMLLALDFTVLLDPAYEQLCALEAAFEGKAAEAVREQIKVVVLNPNETLRYGSASIVAAVQQLTNNGELSERSPNGSTIGNDTLQLRRELQRLASSRRLVSPSHC